MKAFKQTDKENFDGQYQVYVHCKNCGLQETLFFQKHNKLSFHECPNCGCETLSKSVDSEIKL